MLTFYIFMVIINLINYIMSLSNHICPECGDRMIGRADKKYCSDVCRTSFHNKHRNHRNNVIKSINNILERNRNILMEYASAEKASRIRLMELQSLGFDFDYFTHCCPDQNGNVQIFCYEYGYLKMDQGEVQLLRKTA